MNHLYNLHFWLIGKYKVLNVKWQSGAYNTNSTEKLEHSIEGAPPEPQMKYETKLLKFEVQFGRDCFLLSTLCKVTFGILLMKANFLLSPVILWLVKPFILH